MATRQELDARYLELFEELVYDKPGFRRKALSLVDYEFDPADLHYLRLSAQILARGLTAKGEWKDRFLAWYVNDDVVLSHALSTTGFVSLGLPVCCKRHQTAHIDVEYHEYLKRRLFLEGEKALQELSLLDDQLELNGEAISDLFMAYMEALTQTSRFRGEPRLLSYVRTLRINDTSTFALDLASRSVMIAPPLLLMREEIMPTRERDKPAIGRERVKPAIGRERVKPDIGRGRVKPAIGRESRGAPTRGRVKPVIGREPTRERDKPAIGRNRGRAVRENSKGIRENSKSTGEDSEDITEDAQFQAQLTFIYRRYATAMLLASHPKLLVSEEVPPSRLRVKGLRVKGLPVECAFSQDLLSRFLVDQYRRAMLSSKSKEELLADSEVRIQQLFTKLARRYSDVFRAEYGAFLDQR